jgi:hypothetical protein
MSKVITASVICVLLIGSAASADLAQDQYTGIGLTNAVSLMHGEQHAGSLQNLVVDNAQAAIGQSAEACGYCGLVDVAQALGIEGMQAQAVGDGVAPKAQLQTLDVIVAQALGKADGLGTADALHTIVVNEGQYANNAAGSMSESATVMGMQTSTIHGQPGATGIVDATMAVTTTQSQAAL